MERSPSPRGHRLGAHDLTEHATWLSHGCGVEAWAWAHSWCDVRGVGGCSAHEGPRIGAMITALKAGWWVRAELAHFGS